MSLIVIWIWTLRLISERQTLAIVVVVANLISVYDYGVGDHVVYLPPAQEIQINKWSLISEVLVVLSNMFVKLSISLSLLRIFTTKKRRIWAIYAIIIFITLTSVSVAIALLCQFRPIRKIFNPTIPGTCYAPQVILDMAYYQGSRGPNTYRNHSKLVIDIN